MLPTLVRPTDAELADPSRDKSRLELLQGITAQTIFKIDNTGGIAFDGLNAKVGEIPAGSLFKIKDLNLSYVKSSDEWKGSLELFFPPSGAYGAKGSFTIRDGKFAGLSVAALFDPGIQVGCCVRLTKVGGSYDETEWDPDGCLTSPATCSKYQSEHQGATPPSLCPPNSTLTACESGLQVAGLVGLAAGPAIKVGADTKDLLTVDGRLRFVDSTASNPWALSADADFSLLGELPFGNAAITYINGQQFSAYGQVNKTFSAACLSLSFNAMLGVDIYSLTRWQAYAGVGVGGNVCGVFSFSMQQEILASSRGIGACGNITTFWGETYGAGVVYTWDDQAVHMFTGCSHDKLVAEGGVTRNQANTAQLGPRTVRVPAGLPTYLFKLTGSSAAPDVVLTGPTGQTVDTSTVNGARGFAVYRGEDNDRYIDVKSPAAGGWTITPKQGSAPITNVETARGIPDPSVKATVVGAGRTRVLRYRISAIAGQRVRFVERLAGTGGAPGPAHILGETSRKQGELRFIPTTGPRGKRRIEATVLQDGQPRRLLKVAVYTSPGPFRAARPTVRLRRRGTRIIVRWNSVPGAKSYRALIRITAFDKLVGRLVGRSVFVTRKPGQRLVIVRGVSRLERLGASVTPVSGAGILGRTGFASRRG